MSTQSMQFTGAGHHAKFVGRIGALAVALGVGAGFTVGLAGTAWADDGESSTSAESSSNTDQSGVTTQDREQSTGTEQESEPEPDPDTELDPDDETSDDETPDDEAAYGETSDDETSDDGAPTDDAEPVEPDQSPPTDPPIEAAETESESEPPTVGTELRDPRADSAHDDTSVRVEVEERGDITTEPTESTSLPIETTTVNATPLRIEAPESNSTTAADIPAPDALRPPPNQEDAPVAAVDIATGFVAAILSDVSPSPGAPARPPLLFFAILDWVRREIQRTFFNRTPDAVADAYSSTGGADVSGNVLANDTDADDDPLRAALVDGPDHGALTLNADGTFVYVPAENYTGSDVFTYKAKDTGFHFHGLFGIFRPDQGHSDTVEVTITITASAGPVVANDDNVTGDEDISVNIPVLANDTGGAAPLSIPSFTQPAHGSVGLNGGDNSLFYQPNFGFVGTDTFTYTVTDGVTTDTATVHVTVQPVNDMPVTMGDNYTVTAGGTLTVTAPGVLANDNDLDGDVLTAVLFQGPAHGTVNLHPDGSFTYVADADYAGVDQFEYFADDGTTIGNSALVNITVTRETAPVAGYDSLATAIGTALTIDADDLLHNDFDNEGDPLTVIVTQAPQDGELIDNGDGTYTYTPDDGFVGTDMFEYVVADAAGQSAPAVVSINVGIPPNIAPEGSGDFLTLRNDVPRIITPADLLANDTDADGDLLTPYIVSGPDHGTLEYNEGGGFTYTADPGFTGPDAFYYAAYDGLADSTPTLVTLQVYAFPLPNTPPVAGYDSLGTDVDTPLTISPAALLANDFDADGDPLVVSVTEHPLNGTLGTDMAGNLVYTPDAGFTGTDSFFYSAAQPENASLPAQVTITVGGPANTAPQAGADELAVVVDTPLTFSGADLLANDTDTDGDELSVVIVDGPAAGTLVDNEDGTFTYTPDAGFIGPVSFVYTAFDGWADSIPALVTIDVAPAEAIPPTAHDDHLFTPVDTTLTITPQDLFGNDENPAGDPSELGGVIVTFPAFGTLGGDGTGTAFYTPNPGFEGVDWFTYQAEGVSGTSNVATVYITVGQGGL